MTTLEFPEIGEAGISMEDLRTQALQLASDLPGNLKRITLRAGGLTVDVEWEGAPQQLLAPAYPQYGPPPAYAEGIPAPVAGAPAAGPAAVEAAPKSNVVEVGAPLVGTFYSAPSPGQDPFVQVGDIVEPGQTLAIIEAMKLLNNINAEIRAKVVAVHCTDGDVVEFGQALVDLEPVD